MQQRPQRYTRYDKNRQRLKSTCNCTHEFHFPSEFSIISSHSRNSLKRNFSKLHNIGAIQSTQQSEPLELPAIFNFCVFTESSTFSSPNGCKLEQKHTDQDHMHRLMARIPGALESFHGCGRTVYITAVGGRELSITDNIWFALVRMSAMSSLDTST